MSRVKEKKMKKNIWYRTWMGYCPTELKAGLGTGRAGRASGTAQVAWAHGRRVSWRTGAGRWGVGLAGRAGTRALGAGCAGRAGTRALGARGEQAHGHWARRASRRAGQGRAVGGHVLQAHGTGARQAGTRGAAGARGTTSWAAWACSWANGLCTWCTQPVLTLFDSVFFLSR